MGGCSGLQDPGCVASRAVVICIGRLLRTPTNVAQIGQVCALRVGYLRGRSLTPIGRLTARGRRCQARKASRWCC
jgi:hypothetical protein